VPDIPAAPPFASGPPVVTLGNVGKTFANGVVALDRRSVRTQLGHIYEKLGVRSRAELVSCAISKSLL